MAYSFISRFEIKPDRADRFTALCREMEAHVAEAEPETLYFKFYKLDQPNMFAVIESFPSPEADAAHQQHPKAQPIIQEMIGCMGEGGYVREMLHDLG